MKHVLFALAGLAAACDGKEAAVVDAEQPQEADACFRDTCNPLSQTGCEAGQKCTWQHHTEDSGRVACVPDGTVALGDACTFLEPGETTGYDDCASGGYCRGVCKAICEDAPDSCPAKQAACMVYAGIFEECGQPFAGLCEPI